MGVWILLEFKEAAVIRKTTARAWYSKVPTTYATVGRYAMKTATAAVTYKRLVAYHVSINTRVCLRIELQLMPVM